MRRIRTRNEEGATAVEYGVMVALIAVVIIAAVFTLGQTMKDELYDCVADALEGIPGHPDGCTK